MNQRAYVLWIRAGTMPDALSVNSVTCGAFFGLARNLFDESLIMCQFCLEKEQHRAW